MISVILPLSEKETKKQIKDCLDSLKAQAFKNFEVIIVCFPSTKEKLSKLFKNYPFISKIISGNWGKAKARNIGARQAKGKYLYHLDADIMPTPQVFSQCFKKAKKGVKAIIIPDKEAPGPHLITQCRSLEKRLLQNSPTILVPLFLKKSLFEKIKGYDESLDPLDDWDLHLKLKKQGIKFESITAPVAIRETTSFKKALERKYQRGRLYPLFKKKHKKIPYLNPKKRLADYLKNRRQLIKNPLITLSLFFLKAGDVLAFFWGTLRPKGPKNRYALAKVAKKYDQKRLGTYKHLAEIRSLLKLLPKKRFKILEIGCGTGRITKELADKGHKITAVDNSPAMVDEYQKKAGLPKARLADATHLPFSDNSFPIVLSLRLIWHLGKKDIDKMFSEAARVSSDLVILDISNKKRWPKIYRRLHPSDYFFDFKEFARLCKKENLKIEAKIPLDTLIPFWFNFLPSRLKISLFPLVYRADLMLGRFIPPGRYLVKLKKFQKPFKNDKGWAIRLG